jgi:hypothetical protein
MNVHFILDGRPLTRGNWDTFGPDVTEDRVDRIANAVLDVAGEVRCAKHDAPPSVTCRGASLATVGFEVSACCPEFSAALADRLRQRVQPAVLLRPQAGGVVKSTRRHSWRRLHRAFGPILAGMLIDSVDALTFGPLKRFMGFPAGALAGYWMASIFKLPQRQRLVCALAAGIYCVIPGLEFVPVATLIGAWIRFREAGDPPEN